MNYPSWKGQYKYHRKNINTAPDPFGDRDGHGATTSPETHRPQDIAVTGTGENTPTPLDLTKHPERPAEIVDALKPAIYPPYKRGLFWVLLRLVTGKRRARPAPDKSEEEPAPAQPAGPSMVKLVLARLFPGRRILTPEEDLLYRESVRRKAIETQLKSEAGLFMDRITNVLTRRNLCYRSTSGTKESVKTVKFAYVKIYPEAFYFFVEVGKIPRGISVLDLVKTDVLTDLSIATGHRVSAHFSERSGCVYIVERSTGVLGIPNHVKLSDMWGATPAHADGLSIPLGLSTNSKPVYRSLSQMYSLLIAGTIGSGKSNFANVLLCTLIRRNPPDRLKLILVDLKGGLEFSFYEGIPHLLSIPKHAENGICYARDQVPGVLTWLLAEGERRIQIIKASGHKDIGRFNHHNRKQAMPHLVFMADEWADVRLEPKVGKAAEDLLTNIASRFRAVGIHVIICTQTPKVEVISTRIKGVLPAKIGFSVPTNAASMVILDNGNAKSLEPIGRCILQWNDEIQIQTPFISDADIKLTVEGAIAGTFEKIEPKSHDVTELEIMNYALEYESGWLPGQHLYKAFKSRGITQREVLDMIIAWEGQEFVVGSSVFKVTPPSGNRARRLVAVDDTEVKADPEVKNG